MPHQRPCGLRQRRTGALPKGTQLLILFTDFLGHNVMRTFRQAAQEEGVPVLACRRSASCLMQSLERRGSAASRGVRRARPVRLDDSGQGLAGCGSEPILRTYGELRLTIILIVISLRNPGDIIVYVCLQRGDRTTDP